MVCKHYNSCSDLLASVLTAIFQVSSSLTSLFSTNMAIHRWYFPGELKLSSSSSVSSSLHTGIEPLEISGTGYYRLNVLPVTQPTGSKHWQKYTTLIWAWKNHPQASAFLYPSLDYRQKKGRCSFYAGSQSQYRFHWLSVEKEYWNTEHKWPANGKPQSWLLSNVQYQL